MISANTLRHHATYTVSLQTLANASKLAKETVYMPSQIAALVLGRADEQPERTESAPVERQDGRC